MLADRLAELGAPVDRATIARTENGTRGLSLDDALLYALAVGAAPVGMMTITEDGAPVDVAPALQLQPSDARDWIRGNLSLYDQDARTYASEIADDEWIAYQKNMLGSVVAEINLLARAYAADDDEAISRQIEQVNAGLDMLRRTHEEKRRA